MIDRLLFRPYFSIYLCKFAQEGRVVRGENQTHAYFSRRLCDVKATVCVPAAYDVCISVISLAEVEDESGVVLVTLARSAGSLAVIAGVAEGALERNELHLVIVI